ncbi:MAG: hypothetical protein Q9190_001764 [Brigantiaea leucoxantha]
MDVSSPSSPLTDLEQSLTPFDASQLPSGRWTILQTQEYFQCTRLEYDRLNMALDKEMERVNLKGAPLGRNLNKTRLVSLFEHVLWEAGFPPRLATQIGCIKALRSIAEKINISLHMDTKRRYRKKRLNGDNAQLGRPRIGQPKILNRDNTLLGQPKMLDGDHAPLEQSRGYLMLPSNMVLFALRDNRILTKAQIVDLTVGRKPGKDASSRDVSLQLWSEMLEEEGFDRHREAMVFYSTERKGGEINNDRTFRVSLEEAWLKNPTGRVEFHIEPKQ